MKDELKETQVSRKAIKRHLVVNPVDAAVALGVLIVVAALIAWVV